MAQLDDVIKHSITKDDILPGAATGWAGSVVNFWLPQTQYALLNILPDLPPYYTYQADYVLRRTPRLEPYWGAAIKIAVTKMASWAWEVKGPDSIPESRVKRCQELLREANAGKGWTHFIKQQGRDFLTTDNGAHFEVVRASTSAGSKIIGIMHLDSVRCRRTGDPEYPIIYRDRLGGQHLLKYYQVISISDLPEAEDTYFETGLCAARIAYDTIRRMAAMQRYGLEKMTGAKPLEMHIVNGLTDKQVEAGLNSADASRKQKGAIAYGGVVILPTIDDTKGSQGYRIPLASMPDNFDRKAELQDALLEYANSIGIDSQELMPLTGAALGTGAQSQVLDDKQEGKGLASYRQEMMHQLSDNVMSDGVGFFYIEKDWRDKQLAAQVLATTATAITTLADPAKGSILQPGQGLELLVDLDLLPKKFLPDNQTPDHSLSDTDVVSEETTSTEAGEEADQIVVEA